MFQNFAAASHNATPYSSHPLAAYYETLWQRIEAACPVSPLVVGITSCQPRAGTSTVAANLAASASLGQDRDVLLLEANSVRPSLGALFGTQANPGLAQLIRGEALLSDCAHETGIPRLRLITAGIGLAGVEHSRPALVDLVSTLRDNYAVVICDLPPATETSSCYAWAGAVDGLALVLEAGTLQSPRAIRAKQRLEQAQGRLLGVVVNKHVRELPAWME